MKIIPGMEDKNLEVYAFENQLKVVYNGTILTFWELPSVIIEKFLLLMHQNTAAMKGLIAAGYDKAGEEKMLSQFVFCNFGGFNTEPDMDDNGNFNAEYWDCGRANVCPFGCQVCGGLKAENGTISKREIQVIEHVGKGMLNKEIAHVLGISVNTVNNTIANIFEKTGCQNRTELMGWAIKKNLI